jgi:ATP-dependent RNA helicase DDX19/DBP5
MTQDGHAVGLLTGELQIDQRAAIITRFKSGMEKVMITTNVTARGRQYSKVKSNYCKKSLKIPKG